MCSERSARVSPSNPPQWPPKRVHESTHWHTIDRGKAGWLYVVVSCNHVRACSRSCSSPRISSSLCHAHHVRRNGHRRIGKENVISPTRTSLSLPCTTKRGYQMVGVTASRGQVFQTTKRSLAPKWREGSGDKWTPLLEARPVGKLRFQRERLLRSLVSSRYVDSFQQTSKGCDMSCMRCRLSHSLSEEVCMC